MRSVRIVFFHFVSCDTMTRRGFFTCFTDFAFVGFDVFLKSILGCYEKWELAHLSESFIIVLKLIPIECH